MEKQTQQREGHASTRSLPHHRVTPKSGTSPSKKQPPEKGVTQFLQIFDQFKPHIIWVIIVTAAIYDFFWPSNVVGLAEFVILMAWAGERISLPQVISLLRGKLSLRSLPEGKVAGGQPGEDPAEDRDKPI